jgi:hypothetical protein
LNGTTWLATPDHQGYLEASTIHQLAVGDYVELYVWQDFGYLLNLNVNYPPDFMLIKLSD